MKPLRVFQHDACGDMGYLGTYLTQRNIPYEMVYISRGESVPPGLQDVSGLIFLGSTHSVNACHAWIDAELALIRRAADQQGAGGHHQSSSQYADWLVSN